MKNKEIKKEMDFYLTNLVLEIGKQVTRDYVGKNGIWEGMSVNNTRAKNVYLKEFLEIIEQEITKVRIKTIEEVEDWAEQTYYRDVDSYGNVESGASNAIEDLELFLSSLKQSKRKKSEEETHCLSLRQDLVFNLYDLTEDYDLKVENCLSKAEERIISSFKTVLTDIEREMYKLKRSYEGLYNEAPIISEAFLQMSLVIRKLKEEL